MQVFGGNLSELFKQHYVMPFGTFLLVAVGIFPAF